MRKWISIALSAALLLAGAALVWPGAGPAPSVPVAPPTPALQPDFAPIPVASLDVAGLSLTGTIFDPSGRPVPNAEVFLAASAQPSLTSVRCEECGEPLLECPAHETTLRVAALLDEGKGTLGAAASTFSDAKGAFRFERLAGVSFTLWARAKGLGEAVRERAAPGDPVELFLPPLRTIAGSVQDEQGRPIAQARVHALSRRLALPHAALSHSNGTFEVQGLGEGPFFVLAEAPGFLPSVLRGVEAGPQPVRLTLQSPRALEVSVRSGGKPVSARVRLSANHLNREGQAAGGVAFFERLYPDQVVVTATAGPNSSPPHSLSLTEALTRLTLELEPGGSVTVTVVDEAGGPVPDPEVILTTRAGEVVSRSKPKQGALVSFGPLGQGEYFLLGTAEGFQPTELPVSVRSTEVSIELVMARGTVISGRVLDEYGRPAPGISILISPTGDSVLADSEGRFSAQVPSPGLYELHAHHSDWGGGQLKVTAPASGVELQLEPRAGVQVTVQSGGRRVEGASVVLWVDREGSFRSDRPSGPDGLVLMRGMPAGGYWLIAAHPEYLPSERQRVQVEEGTLLKVVAELKPGAAISGQVVDRFGAPVPGVSLSVVPRGAGPATSDGLGRFELRALRPKVPYRIEARHPNFEQLERVQAVAGGEPVKVLMIRREVFRGRVMAEEGKPLRHFRIDDHEVDSADGRFELPLSSADGRVIFALESPGYEPMMVDRPVAPDLGDLVLKRAPESSGVVRDEAGGPVADAVVTCDVCDQSVLSGADGRFKLSTPPYVFSYAVTARKGRLSGTTNALSGGAAPIEVVLKGAARLFGVAFLSNGKPAAGVEIEGMNVDRSEPLIVVTGSDGSYQADVAPGAYRFSFLSLDPEPPPAHSGLGDSLAVMAEVRGPQSRLDFGPAPGTASVSVRLQPQRGHALWIIRGDLPAVGNPPIELLRAPYGQLLYQPSREQVTLTGLVPGRYTLVWGSFHLESPAGPMVRRIEVPAPGEVVLGP